MERDDAWHGEEEHGAALTSSQETPPRAGIRLLGFCVASAAGAETLRNVTPANAGTSARTMCSGGGGPLLPTSHHSGVMSCIGTAGQANCDRHAISCWRPMYRGSPSKIHLSCTLMCGTNGRPGQRRLCASLASAARTRTDQVPCQLCQMPMQAMRPSRTHALLKTSSLVAPGNHTKRKRGSFLPSSVKGLNV